MRTDDNEKAFLETIDWSAYRSVGYAFVAARRGGELHNLRCRLILDTLAPARRPEVESIGTGVIACRGRAPLNVLRDNQGLMERHSIKLGAHCLSFRVPEDSRAYYWTLGNTLEHSRQLIGWPGHYITGSGDSIWKVLGPGEMQRLEEQLPAQKPDRFTSWTQLIQRLALGSELNESGSCLVDIFLPIYARLSRPAMSYASGRFDVEVETRLLPLEADLEIVVSPERTGVQVISCPPSTWKRTRSGRVWRVSGELPADTGRAKVQLLSKERRIWQESAAAPSLAVKVHGCLDPGALWLRNMLFPAKRKPRYQDDFEQGVAALLNVGGLPAVHYGHASLDHFVDLVACVGNELFLVLECTVESPTTRKIAALAGRCARLHDRCTADGDHAIAIPAIVVPVALSDLPVEVIAEARKLRVGFVGREQLELLLEMISAGDAPATIANTVAAWAARPLQRRRF